MNKIKKEVVIITSIILVILAGYLMFSSIAETIEEWDYMTIYNNPDPYLTCSRTDAIKYIGNNIKTPSVENDYKEYVKPNKGIWCLSEKQVNTRANLKVYAIIDIGKEDDPTNTYICRLTSNNNTAENRNVKGAGKKRRAQSAFTMMAGVTVTETEGNITGTAHKHFYNTFDEIFDNTQLQAMFDDSSDGGANPNNKLKRNETEYDHESYGDAINNLHYSSDNKNGCIYNSNENSYGPSDKNTKNYKTKIITNMKMKMNGSCSLIKSRKITITKIDNTTIKYEIRKNGDYWYLYSGNINKGRLVTDNGNIYLRDQIDAKKQQCCNRNYFLSRTW